VSRVLRKKERAILQVIATFTNEIAVLNQRDENEEEIKEYEQLLIKAREKLREVRLHLLNTVT
jgi:hypothetical protein